MEENIYVEQTEKKNGFTFFVWLSWNDFKVHILKRLPKNF